jgi:rubredoxin-NAD+ reductase
MTYPIIIIGAGLAGWTTAREIRKLDARTPLLLVTADGGDFYAKPSLSNAMAQRRSPAQLVSTAAAKMADTLQLTLLAHTPVSAINPADQTIRTAQGELAYRQLVLATGAQPIRVPLAGDAAEQVLSVNSLDDFSVFYDRLACEASYEINSTQAAVKKHIVIMGAGLIGCEFANDLAASGYRVSVVDPSAGPLAALLPAAAGEQLRAALAELGVRWYFGTTVAAVQHASGTAGALSVELASGERLSADVVLSAIGLRANTTLAQAAGLACARGIQVDAHLQTSQPQIYALGDGAQYAGGRTLPYVMPIMNAAKALAATLTGSPTALVFPVMPVAIKTPAYPMLVAAAAPGTVGEWVAAEPGVWHLIDPQGLRLGFVLTGAQTARRAEQLRLLAV